MSDHTFDLCPPSKKNILNASIQDSSGDSPSQAIRISACLIVKDGAATLDRCLASIVPVVDEIIVVDTGSTDGSIEIAQRYTDKVFFYAWHDDFAAARNESLRHATGDWVMVIDADEWIETTLYPMIQKYISHYATQNAEPKALPVLQARVIYPERPALFKRFLFPNHLNLHFYGRVHEILTHPQSQIQGWLCHELVVQHGATDTNQAQTKHRYYHQLLTQSLSEPLHAEMRLHTLKHLGDSYWKQGHWQKSQEAYQQFIQGLNGSEYTQDPFVFEVRQKLKILRQKQKRQRWRKIGILAGLGILAACQPAPPLNSLTSPNLGNTSTTSRKILSEQEKQRLRQRFGPNITIGIDNPAYENYLAQKQAGKMSPVEKLMDPTSFRVQTFDDDYPVNEFGCPSIFAAVRICIPHINTGSWESVTQCYQRGGAPVYTISTTCQRLQNCPEGHISYDNGPWGFYNYPPGVFLKTDEAGPVFCAGVDDDSGGESSGGFCPEGEAFNEETGMCESANIRLESNTPVFSPNDDLNKDSVIFTAHTDPNEGPATIEVQGYERGPKDANGFHTQGSACHWRQENVNNNDTILWDGHCHSGKRMADGLYTATLKQGKYTHSIELGVDTVQPRLQRFKFGFSEGNFNLSFETFDPLVNDYASGVAPISAQSLHFNVDEQPFTPTVQVDSLSGGDVPQEEESGDFSTSAIQNKTTDSTIGDFRITASTLPTDQVLKVTLTIPISEILPTLWYAFQVAVNRPPDNAANGTGKRVTKPVPTKPYNPNGKDPIFEPCSLKGYTKNMYLIDVADNDKRGPDLSFTLIPNPHADFNFSKNFNLTNTSNTQNWSASISQNGNSIDLLHRPSSNTNVFALWAEDEGSFWTTPDTFKINDRYMSNAPMSSPITSRLNTVGKLHTLSNSRSGFNIPASINNKDSAFTNHTTFTLAVKLDELYPQMRINPQKKIELSLKIGPETIKVKLSLDTKAENGNGVWRVKAICK